MKMRLAAAVCIAGWLAVQHSFAGGIPTGVGGDPPVGPFIGNVDTGVNVDNNGEPIPIWLDPDGGPWLKQIEVHSPNGFGPGQRVSVWERIHIVPPPTGLPLLPITDWHEEVHAPNWTWAGGHLKIHNSNTTWTGKLGGPQGMNTNIWFEFPPHMPLPTAPIDLWIHKYLQYNGPQTSTTVALIEVWEYPTTVPEPASWMLAVLGASSLVAVYRCRR